ncbi:MAG: hypothetical protein HFH68_13340 [Lachnospiraceae bacterium]|nr:hypothetical protein [Lachnospiraceae bacterium]
MIDKGCEVNYDFKNGFILGEEHLQILSSKIKERYPEEELIYKITKNNSYIFQTLDINEIFKEENSNANIINKLEIIINNEDTVNFSLCFEKGKNTSLKIIGTNKDRIFLLYNEIKTYVEKEITTVKIFFKNNDLFEIYVYILLSLLSLLFLFIVFIEPDLSYNKKEIEDILNSSDIHLKLNFLINKQSNEYFHKYDASIIPSSIAIVLIFLCLFIYIFNKNRILKITDYFLFGKQKNVYEKK